ncbi:MAG: restriction endonuclease subunit S [Succinatimonas sp.]|nr:restriction endonuclease subunit S [Succinatimonas sp.]
MSKDSKKPVIRFKGFTDDWEQRKFWDVAEYRKGPFGSAIKKDMFVKKDKNTVKVYEQQNAIEKDWKIERYYLQKSYVEDKLKSFWVNPGDIIVSCAGTIGELYELPNEAEKGVINQALMRIRVHQNLVNTSLFEMSFSNMISDFTKLHSNGSAIKNIPQFSELKKISFLVPKLNEEQDSLVNFFKDFESIITLHQRKLDKLKNIKKALLEKMFPRNGENIPEVRFKGFSDDWEQRELGSVFEKFTDGDWIESKDQSNEGIRLVQTGNVGIGEYIDKSDHAKWISESSFYKLKCKEIHEGDILISRLPDPAGRACIVPKLSTRAITAVDCTIAKASKDFDSKFILQFLCSSLYFSQVNTCLAGGTRQRISRTNLHNCEINLPTSSSEQIKIGEMLSRLDVSITLHQRKLDKLKNIKKALLEKMFV